MDTADSRTGKAGLGLNLRAALGSVSESATGGSDIYVFYQFPR
jgi:hypothetical protein